MERPPSNVTLNIDAEFQKVMSSTLEKMVHEILMKKPDDPVRSISFLKQSANLVL